MSDAAVQRIHAFLDSTGLEYTIMDCDPALADTAVFCEHYGVPLDCSVNTLLVKAKTGGERFAACVLLATTRLDVNRVVRKRLEARRVSFASADETREVTGMEIGGVTPIGLPEDLALWVDRRVMDAPYVVLGGGDRSTKIKISPRVFEHVPSSTVVEGLARPPDDEA
ncbi:MAG: YbaK/EbsC family protein [Gammaproteobacteria bacterium]|nr:YbaK/EbsC family protein [Gammaproteobacteria bacterium]